MGDKSDARSVGAVCSLFPDCLRSLFFREKRENSRKVENGGSVAQVDLIFPTTATTTTTAHKLRQNWSENGFRDKWFYTRKISLSSWCL